MCFSQSFRVVQLSKNADANEQWLRKFGPMMKILGPIIILGGARTIVWIVSMTGGFLLSAAANAALRDQPVK